MNAPKEPNIILSLDDDGTVTLRRAPHGVHIEIRTPVGTDPHGPDEANDGRIYKDREGWEHQRASVRWPEEETL